MVRECLRGSEPQLCEPCQGAGDFDLDLIKPFYANYRTDILNYWIRKKCLPLLPDSLMKEPGKFILCTDNVLCWTVWRNNPKNYYKAVREHTKLHAGRKPL